MYAATRSVALLGGDATPVEVEVHVGGQKEVFKLSGLPDTALREAKERVRAALTASGASFPNRRVTVNLAPADIPKRGTDYDLPIALGVLAASGDIARPVPAIVVGELALDGSVRPGAASFGAAVLSARTKTPCIVAQSTAAENAGVPGSQVYGVESLAQAVEVLASGFESGLASHANPPPEAKTPGDLSEVRGQFLARRALEISATGGHHLLMHGPPGGGKTMMARLLPAILPPLGDEETVEVALLYAAAGLRRGLTRSRPFRAPHHTASRAALVGGGSGVPVPGEVSLAHRGVLFLDELAEFPRGNLDTLRQPLEGGSVTVARRGSSVEFPASFQLVAASNPCSCGFLGDARKPCTCRPSELSRHRRRISGPLLDRFDLVVRVGRVEGAEVTGPDPESSQTVAKRVAAARHFAAQRRSDSTGDARNMVLQALDAGVITARGAARIRRLARTIADIEQVATVGEDHVAEALALRGAW
ncbi:MAG: YifB family Mg chelatase-like AAA ATPase [Acidimicrobiia bacterium]|nr:YifB family Mg chelatase-like AAA ATPase [Acidimicrobiia bacterium]